MKGRHLQKCIGAIKAPKHPLDQKRKVSLGFALCLNVFYMFFLSSEHTKKNTLKPLDSSLFTKNTRYCSYTRSSSPWFYILDLGFRGVDVAF